MYKTRCCFSLLLLPLLLPILLPGQTAVRPAVHFEGQVVSDTTGLPIAGAQVRILAPSQSQSSTSDGAIYTKADGQGRFAFANLPSGRYMVTIRAPGYDVPGRTQFREPPSDIDLRPPSQPAARPAGVAPPPPPQCISCLTNVEKSLAADGTLHASAVIRLTPVIVIAGRVTDPDGIPMPNLRVRAIAASAIAAPSGVADLTKGAEAWSNDLGEFRIAHLPPGSYYLMANQGYGRLWLSTYRSTFYPRAIDVSAATPLVLDAGQQLRADIQIARQSGSLLSGRISLPAGSPRAPNSFLITSISLRPVPKQVPNASDASTYSSGGRFVIEDVLPGTYILTAMTFEKSYDAPVDTHGEPRFGLSRQIAITADEAPVFDLELLPLREIPGDLSFAPGCQRVPVNLMAETANGRFTAFPVDPADGRFVLTRLQPGGVHVSAVPEPGSGIIISATSIRLGDQEVSRTGFDYPLQGDQLLHVTIGCGNGGAR